MAAFVRVAASSGHPVLIAGETGCGKTHLARLIHAAGPRSHRPFVRVNCASIPDTLFEREMFGHVRGAYTDARGDAAGFLEAADGGVLFLDEIGELSLAMQPKLLAVLEDGCFRRLGSPREVRVDVQVIAATHRGLADMTRLRQFREDLFYRLSVLRYTMLPLRERTDEIPALVAAILRDRGGSPAAITDEALQMAIRYPWPGNIRELENALRAASSFAGGGPILPRHLPPEVRAGARPASPDGSFPAVAERYTAPADLREEVERIERVLRDAGGNKTRAARALGMSRTTLWTKLQRYHRELGSGGGSSGLTALVTLWLAS